eukprot:scaffold13230_cov98-Isochrysis_galbana.AAC.4
MAPSCSQTARQDAFEGGGYRQRSGDGSHAYERPIQMPAAPGIGCSLNEGGAVSGMTSSGSPIARPATQA